MKYIQPSRRRKVSNRSISLSQMARKHTGSGTRQLRKQSYGSTVRFPFSFRNHCPSSASPTNIANQAAVTTYPPSPAISTSPTISSPPPDPPSQSSFSPTPSPPTKHIHSSSAKRSSVSVTSSQISNANPKI